MRIVTTAQMRGIEAYASHKLGIPALLLMENAALGAAARVEGLLACRGRVTVVCGPGNNGGDGFALARKLCAGGREVAVIFVGDPEAGGAETRLNRDIAHRMGIPVHRFNGSGDGDAAQLIGAADVVVDALFGIGLTRAPEGLFAAMIRLINTRARRIVALDIPSGVDADTGHVAGEAVRAHMTVTFGFMKPGLLLYPGAACAGEVCVADLSMPMSGAGLPGTLGYVLTDADIPGLLPPRPAVAHKGSCGRVQVYAGSRDMPGAAVLCAAAAYRAGAGLVAVGTVEEAAQAVRMHVPEALAAVLPGKDGRIAGPVPAEVNGVLLMGPGLGQGPEVTAFVQGVLETASAPVVLDADGLNAVAAEPALLRKMNAPCVITPHPGEMSRLTGCTVGDIVSTPIETARTFARDYGVYVLLKGARTVVAAPEGDIFINTTGTPALAKAGSGDALAGMIAGLLAQGTAMADACALGAYLHGRAGERAAAVLSVYGVNGTDTIRMLPEVLKGFGSIN